MALDLGRDGNSIKLKVTNNTTKVLGLTFRHTLPICTNGHSIEGVDQLANLESVRFTRGGTVLDVGIRTNRVGSTLIALCKIWKWKYLGTNLREHCVVRTRWPDTISKKNAFQIPMGDVIRKLRWEWAGGKRMQLLVVSCSGARSPTMVDGWTTIRALNSEQWRGVRVSQEVLGGVKAQVKQGFCRAPILRSLLFADLYSAFMLRASSRACKHCPNGGVYDTPSVGRRFPPSAST